MKIYMCKDEECSVSYEQDHRRVQEDSCCGCGSDLKVATAADVEKIRVERDKLLAERADRTKAAALGTPGLPYLLVGKTQVVKRLDGSYSTHDGKIKVESYLDAFWLASYTEHELQVSSRGNDAADAADNLSTTLSVIKNRLGNIL